MCVLFDQSVLWMIIKEVKRSTSLNFGSICYFHAKYLCEGYIIVSSAHIHKPSGRERARKRQFHTTGTQFKHILDDENSSIYLDPFNDVQPYNVVSAVHWITNRTQATKLKSMLHLQSMCTICTSVKMTLKTDLAFHIKHFYSMTRHTDFSLTLSLLWFEFCRVWIIHI